MFSKTHRIYVDTSVFGGCFDKEFETPSKTFFEKVRSGDFALVLSDVTLIELRSAPKSVVGLLDSIPDEFLEQIPFSDEIGTLCDAYVSAGIVGKASVQDAEHVASATVAEVDLVVSWNFRHIVHFEKIAGYQGVNLIHGYPPIRIYSPMEVI